MSGFRVVLACDRCTIQSWSELPSSIFKHLFRLVADIIDFENNVCRIIIVYNYVFDSFIVQSLVAKLKKAKTVVLLLRSGSIVMIFSTQPSNLKCLIFHMYCCFIYFFNLLGYILNSFMIIIITKSLRFFLIVLSSSFVRRK